MFFAVVLGIVLLAVCGAYGEPTSPDAARSPEILRSLEVLMETNEVELLRREVAALRMEVLTLRAHVPIVPLRDVSGRLENNPEGMSVLDGHYQGDLPGVTEGVREWAAQAIRRGEISYDFAAQRIFLSAEQRSALQGRRRVESERTIAEARRRREDLVRTVRKNAEEASAFDPNPEETEAARALGLDRAFLERGNPLTFSVGFRGTFVHCLECGAQSIRTAKRTWPPLEHEEFCPVPPFLERKAAERVTA